MSITVYGIPNCDTVKKARKWLDAQGMDYAFHDYKKQGADAVQLESWIGSAGLDAVLNKRGTTWRKLSEAEQAQAESMAGAVALLVANPSMIKRPVVEHPGGLLVGFNADEWAQVLA
ncbi:MAG: ArsC family reductase [Sphingomonadaceae bacterium]|nr:ArsC family reductase [Sphingomonadaceae bacterium]